MGTSRSVRDRLGHAVLFCPDDVAAQPPAVCLKGEGDSPGDTAEVFGLQPIRNRPRAISVDTSKVCVLLAEPTSALGSHRVRVSKVQPNRPVPTQNPSDLTEHFD